MENCAYCGKEDSDVVCRECLNIFCEDCMEDGLCPTCGGREDPDDIEEIETEEV